MGNYEICILTNPFILRRCWCREVGNVFRLHQQRLVYLFPAGVSAARFLSVEGAVG